MKALRVSSNPPFTAESVNTLSRAEVFHGLCSDTTTSSARSSLSVLSTRENVAWREFDVKQRRISPLRAPPPLPCSSTSHSSCSSLLEVEEQMNIIDGKGIGMEMEIKGGIDVGEEVRNVNDTTALSDLSDEIQKVEARLAAIRMEEEALCLSKRSALHYSSVPRNNNPPITTNKTSIAHPPEMVKKESFTGLRNYLNTTTLSGGESTYNSSLVPSREVRERSCESNPTVVSVVSNPSDVVFSLASFLQPIRTVDIEVSPGVYEKLQIFADDDMEEVAKRFIAKHNLNEQRALKPLYTFLSSLISKENEKENKKNEQQTRACSEISYPVENINISAPTSSFRRINNGQSSITEKSSKSSISNMKISREKGVEDYSMNPKKKQQEQQQQQHQHQSIRDTVKPALKSMLNSSGTKEKSRFSCKSNEGLVHHPTQDRYNYQKERRTTTPIGRSNSPRIIRRSTSSSNSNSKAQEYRYVDPHTVRNNIERSKVESSSLFNSHQPPDIVAVEVQKSNGDNLQKRNKNTIKGEKSTFGSARPSRCNSVEGRRTISSARRIQSIYDVEEPLPTFKPTLAPRSEQLVAKDTQRCQTPTYVRLHAQTMKKVPKQTKTTTTTKRREDYRGKPRILSRSQEKVSHEPVGNRLYEQAIEQQRRLEEKRLKEQQKKEEEEWRSLLAVPQINKEKNTRVHTKSQLQRNVDKVKVKPREERELEACTFAPAVNPASLRMFNMVVRGQIIEDAGMSTKEKEEKEEKEEGRGSRDSHREMISVEERLLLQEEKRRKRLEDERHFREKFDAATGRPLFRPFLGR
ncbi:uncharacterized protein TM35_000014450 [Trypanosoma theileri]|uniref:Uncharacterized protein n=1 Tax=Trypanosoma theileri TaxID=67003 RepID=A0A1X0P9L4_9TRYP|nr:uncharacterized protein TM35_000014450 [Trypanosoma theileri]ORC93568.1 hypothetical protein TM35_000014450 [Trypanosoma theileri]